MLSGDFSLSGFRTSPSPDDNPAGLAVRLDTCLGAWGAGANKDSHGYVCRGGRNPRICNLGLCSMDILCCLGVDVSAHDELWQKGTQSTGRGILGPTETGVHEHVPLASRRGIAIGSSMWCLWSGNK